MPISPLPPRATCRGLDIGLGFRHGTYGLPGVWEADIGQGPTCPHCGVPLRAQPEPSASQPAPTPSGFTGRVESGAPEKSSISKGFGAGFGGCFGVILAIIAIIIVLGVIASVFGD